MYEGEKVKKEQIKSSVCIGIKYSYAHFSACLPRRGVSITYLSLKTGVGSILPVNPDLAGRVTINMGLMDSRSVH